MSPEKRPKSRPEAVGRGDRRPKADPPRVFDDRDTFVTFSFMHVDREFDGDWGWPTGKEAAEMLRFFCDYSRSKWSEIDMMTYNGAKKYRKRLHHSMPFGTVCDLAQRRIEALKLDQVFDEFFRFRLGSDRRFWGFRRDGVFYPLWWDAVHGVYPLDD